MTIKKVTEAICCAGVGFFQLDTPARNSLQCVPHTPRGTWKRVRIPHGPAAVTGDESRALSLFATGEWEDAVSRMIQKSEDLPVG